MAKWKVRVPEMRELLKTMTVTEVANYYGCNKYNIYSAMSDYKIRIKAGRFKPEKIQTCVCGETFKPDKPTSRYCSRPCVIKYKLTKQTV